MKKYNVPRDVADLFTADALVTFQVDQVGTNKDSTLWTGGAYNLRLSARGGDDEILITGSGMSADNIYAIDLGSGDDFFFGQSEQDVVLGGGGNDSLIGGKGRDRLYGQAGNDYLRDGQGGSFEDDGDVLNGGDGNDVYDFSGFAMAYDNGGTRNIYNVRKDAEVTLHLSENSTGTLDIAGDSDHTIFAREGNTLIVGNYQDGTYASIKHYFDANHSPIFAFTCEDGTVLGPINLEKGANEGFENLMI